MRVAGTATLGAPVEQVFAALSRPDMLARTIPGCDTVESLGEGAYRMTVTAGIASIKGRYQADVRLIADERAPYAFGLQASGAGAPGHFVADASVMLADAPGKSTVVSYTVEMSVGGAVGALGRHILTRAAKKSATEFLRCLDRLLLADSEALADALPATKR